MAAKKQDITNHTLISKMSSLVLVCHACMHAHAVYLSRSNQEVLDVNSANNIYIEFCALGKGKMSCWLAFVFIAHEIEILIQPMAKSNKQIAICLISRRMFLFPCLVPLF